MHERRGRLSTFRYGRSSAIGCRELHVLSSLCSGGDTSVQQVSYHRALNYTLSRRPLRRAYLNPIAFWSTALVASRYWLRSSRSSIWVQERGTASQCTASGASHATASSR